MELERGCSWVVFLINADNITLVSPTVWLMVVVWHGLDQAIVHHL